VQSNNSRACLMRVLVDGHPDVELAGVHDVMQRIQRAVRQVVPADHQAYVGNALLNLAVSRLVHEAGVRGTATLLARIVDSIHDRGAPPPPEAAIDLTATHS